MRVDGGDEPTDDLAPPAPLPVPEQQRRGPSIVRGDQPTISRAFESGVHSCGQSKAKQPPTRSRDPLELVHDMGITVLKTSRGSAIDWQEWSQGCCVGHLSPRARNASYGGRTSTRTRSRVDIAKVSWRKSLCELPCLGTRQAFSWPCQRSLLIQRFFVGNA